MHGLVELIVIYLSFFGGFSVGLLSEELGWVEVAMTCECMVSYATFVKNMVFWMCTLLGTQRGITRWKERRK